MAKLSESSFLFFLWLVSTVAFSFGFMISSPGQLDEAMFVPGTLGNTLTVLVIWKTRRLHNHCTTFLLNLALSNLLCCATSMPVMPFQ